MGIAAYAHFAPQEYVFKWIPACAVGQIITVYVLGAFVFYRHQKSEPIDGFVKKLTTFALGRETSCRIQVDPIFHRLGRSHFLHQNATEISTKILQNIENAKISTKFKIPFSPPNFAT